MSLPWPERGPSVLPWRCYGVATVLLRCCYGVAPLCIPWVSLGYPLGIPWVALVHPLYSREDFGRPTVSPPSLSLALTALVGPLFKRNRIFPCVFSLGRTTDLFRSALLPHLCGSEEFCPAPAPNYFLSLFFDNGPNRIESVRIFQASTPASDGSLREAPAAAQPRQIKPQAEEPFRTSHETELTIQFLRLVNESTGTRDLVRAAVTFTHGLCPDCIRKFYPELEEAGPHTQ